MNRGERAVADKYQQEGWEVVRAGAPDFLFVRRDGGRIVEVIAAEVKQRGEELRPNQKVWAEALQAVGITFRIERVPVLVEGGYRDESPTADIDEQSLAIDFEGYVVLFAVETAHNFKAWCPWCEEHHFHGKVEGHRVAHCREGPFIEASDESLGSGYEIVRRDPA